VNATLLIGRRARGMALQTWTVPSSRPRRSGSHGMKGGARRREAPPSLSGTVRSRRVPAITTRADLNPEHFPLEIVPPMVPLRSAGSGPIDRGW